MQTDRSRISSPQAKHSRNSRTVSFGEDGVQGAQVAHTLTACCRCRHRKTRCDTGLPRCTPCKKNNAVCDYFDASKGKKMPRAYVVHLQERVRELEQEIAGLAQEPPSPVDVERLMREASLVKIKENDEFPRFLGPSSGIAMTRLVMEMAKDLCNAKSINEIVPEQKAKEIRQRFAEEASKPTSKVYPKMSFVAAPSLPSFNLTEELVQNFHLKSQSLWPVFHEPSFQKVVHSVYQGSSDPYENFALRMVIAISMQKLDTVYAGLADSYYLAALPYLEDAIRPKDLRSLQCFVLIALYSISTPTRTAAYWVVGLATRICQELRIVDEAHITNDDTGRSLNAIEVDLRRRLFWICLSMELGLAHSLGRPSAFAMSHAYIDVQPFLLVDDKYITSSGVLPGSPVSMRKSISMHFMRMRLLQLEIRRTLYLRKRHSPANDSDPWFKQMELKLKKWLAESPRDDEGSGISQMWFKTKYNTMVVFLFRPCPQVPEPSIRAAQQCFEASRFNIYVQSEQFKTKSMDLTWISTQSLFMAINTLLWTISYPSIRHDHPKAEIELHLQTALDAVHVASLKWPGVASALQLYLTLAEACMTAYDGDASARYGVPMSRDTVHADVDANLGRHSISFPTDSSPISSHGRVRLGSPHVECTEVQIPQMDTKRPNESNVFLHDSTAPSTALPIVTYSVSAEPSQSLSFDLSAYSNPLPPPLSYNVAVSSADSAMDRSLFFGTFGDPYTQILHAGYANPGPIDGLSLEQQSELMDNLETNRIGGQLRETSPRQILYAVAYAS